MPFRSEWNERRNGAEGGTLKSPTLSAKCLGERPNLLFIYAFHAYVATLRLRNWKFIIHARKYACEAYISITKYNL